MVVRNLVTGKDTARARRRASRAGTPPVPAKKVRRRSARRRHSRSPSDSSTVVFSTFPPKAETDKAKKEKKTAEQMPKDGMVIVDLASGKATRVERVKRFAHAREGRRACWPT